MTAIPSGSGDATEDPRPQPRQQYAELSRSPALATNVNLIYSERATVGEQMADEVTGWLGSWRFIAIQSLLILIWIALNTVAWRTHWDPYPFILLNLAFSFEAAFAAPVIMMSQNRQAAKDRYRAEVDHAVNLQAEQDIAQVHARLDDLAGRQWEALVDLQGQQLELLGRIEALTRELHRVTIK